MAKRPLRIAFVGRFYWHNGSSHALLGYHRAGTHLHYDVRVSSLGIVDDVVQEQVPVAGPDWVPDLMVFVFEERFLRSEAFKTIEKLVPRARRVVIDPDGKYSEPVTVGSDTNHLTPGSRADWSGDFERLSDTILQPRLGTVTPGTKRFLYFGVDTHRQQAASDDREKTHDLVYVGNNWYRWHDFVWLLEALAPVRKKMGRIAIHGQYWDGDPLAGYEAYTYSDPDFMRLHDVETYPSVPFDSVESVMGLGRVSPIFVRPVLNALELATPRMFETFAADTVPLIPRHMPHVQLLYGPDVAPLYLSDDPSGVVMKILGNYSTYTALAREIRARLLIEHSYRERLKELLSFLG